MEKYQKRIRIFGQSALAIGILLLVSAVLYWSFILPTFGVAFILLGRSIKNNPGITKKVQVIITTYLAMALVLGVVLPVLISFLGGVTEFYGFGAFPLLIRLILPLILLIEGFVARHAIAALKNQPDNEKDIRALS